MKKIKNKVDQFFYLSDVLQDSFSDEIKKMKEEKATIYFAGFFYEVGVEELSGRSFSESCPKFFREDMKIILKTIKDYHKDSIKKLIEGK